MRPASSIAVALTILHLSLGVALAQEPPAAASDAEKHELAEAVQEANTSPFDMIRALETHLRKYPKTSLRPDIQRLLAKSAVAADDHQRIVMYGVPTLAVTPNDAQLLDGVAASLMALGGRENATKALEYAKRLEDYVIRVPVPLGTDPVRNQEEHDRSLARALLYQARALGVIGMNDDARRKAALAFIAYPDEAAAREWSGALERLRNHPEAIERMADAFAIPDSRASQETRAVDRKQLSEMYRELHGGSEAGLGDLILAAYDRTSATIEKRQTELRKLDPNMGLREAGQFTLSALDGSKLPLPSLRGKVLILDFWATWCVPCRAQHPLYEEVKKRFADRSDVMFLSINSDEDHDAVSPFLDEAKWSRTVYFESGLARLLSVSDIPATLVLDKDGRLVSRMNGYLPETFVDQLTARVQAALAGPVESVK